MCDRCIAIKKVDGVMCNACTTRSQPTTIRSRFDADGVIPAEKWFCGMHAPKVVGRTGVLVRGWAIDYYGVRMFLGNDGHFATRVNGQLRRVTVEGTAAPPPTAQPPTPLSTTDLRQRAIAECHECIDAAMARLRAAGTSLPKPAVAAPAQPAAAASVAEPQARPKAAPFKLYDPIAMTQQKQQDKVKAQTAAAVERLLGSKDLKDEVEL